MASYSTVLVGPWGSSGGAAWKYVAKGKICRIFVTYDANTIHSIKFTSVDKDGNLESSGVFGGTNGTQSKEIVIDTNVDELEMIEGKVGDYGSIITVTSLTFTTRKKIKHGPFGSAKGTAFTLRLSKDSFAGFHGFSGELLNSIGVSALIKTGEALGPSGNAGGIPWSYSAKGVISHINVAYTDDVIHSLRFTSKDSSGNLYYSDVFGSSDGGTKKEFVVDTAVEKLIGITGTSGIHGGARLVTSLTFVTNKNRSFGPFGGKGDTPFSYLVKEDEVLAGFHGNCGWLIDSIGIYKRPASLSSVRVGPTGGTGSTKYSYEPKGSITRIIITYQDSLYSLKFEGLDENGKPENSATFGSYTGSKKQVIDIDPKEEKIVSISGYIDDRPPYQIVSALSIATDKKIIYGPYGATKGTEFSFPIKDGYVSGFHGDSQGLVHSIGVFVKPA